jgi:succinate dehydrogenase / fumarate reductase membrane anchor subunit
VTSSKGGTGHWWAQRLTAGSLLFLGIWFLISIVSLENLHFAAVSSWFNQPLNSILMLMTFASLVYHSNLGVQVVIEDYVHGPTINALSLRLNNLAHLLLMMAGAFAVFKVGFGAA